MVSAFDMVRVHRFTDTWKGDDPGQTGRQARLIRNAAQIAPVGPADPSGVTRIRNLDTWRTKPPFSSLACTGCQSEVH